LGLVGSLGLACSQGTPAPETPDTAAGAPNLARAPETPENHRAAAVRVLDTLNMQDLMDAMVDSSLDSQIAAMPQLAQFEEQMRAFLRKHASWASLREDFIGLYVEAYTQRELEDVEAFYVTPTGKKTISLMPELARKGAVIGQRRVQEHLPELQAMIAAQMRGPSEGTAPSPPAAAEKPIAK
jgi:uncharacterized protein